MFGSPGPLLPDQTIDRNFTIGVFAPNGFLTLAYPAKFSDSDWEDADLYWNVSQILPP